MGDLGLHFLYRIPGGSTFRGSFSFFCADAASVGSGFFEFVLKLLTINTHGGALLR